MKNIKCSQCGGTEFVEAQFIGGKEYKKEEYIDHMGRVEYRDLFDQIDESNSVIGLCDSNSCDVLCFNNCECYICKTCGHIEFFANGYLDKLKEKELEEKKKADEKAMIEAKRLELKKKINQAKELVECLDAMSKDEDVTIKEHNVIIDDLSFAKEMKSAFIYFDENWDRRPNEYSQEWDRLLKEREHLAKFDRLYAKYIK